MLLRIVFGTVARERARESHSRTVQKTLSLNHVSNQKWRQHLKKTKDHIAGSPAAGKSVAGIINLLVDDLFGTGGDEMDQRVLTRLRKDFPVGSEDRSAVTFTGQISLDTRYAKWAVH